jgi:hypothetical protein
LRMAAVFRRTGTRAGRVCVTIKQVAERNRAGLIMKRPYGQPRLRVEAAW